MDKSLPLRLAFSDNVQFEFSFGTLCTRCWDLELYIDCLDLPLHKFRGGSWGPAYNSVKLENLERSFRSLKSLKFELF